MSQRSRFGARFALSTLRARIYIVSFVGVMAGCGPYPPSVSSKIDIDALPLDTKSITARSLPDSGIPALSRLRNLTILDFTSGFARNDITTGFEPWEAEITDAGVEKLSELKLPHLETLTLGYCQNITDVGLAHIAKIDSITWLSVQGCPQITDAGLIPLVEMKSLTGLDLRNCPGVTDQGLQLLKTKTNWEWILLGGCNNLTKGGTASLQKALPKARVDLRVD